MATKDPTFWDRRFRVEGSLWGDEPSPSVLEAEEVFRERGARSVLVPGCAYGRHCVHLARAGFSVVGLDASEVGLSMAARAAADADLDIMFAPGDVTAMPFEDGMFDAVYERALLHLLLRPERVAAVAEYRRVLRPGGVLYLTAFSTEDAECGQGEEVEPGTFDSKGGRPAHFFSEDDLRGLLDGFSVQRMAIVGETEDHGGEVHEHRFWRIVAERL